MTALPNNPTERDRERFRDLTKAIVAGLEYNRCPDGEYREATTQIAWRIWWSVERERQLLQNLNMSQGCKLSELAQKLGKAEAELARLRAAPNEIGLGKGEFVIWPVKINGVHGLAFVKTDDPKVVGTSHAEPEDGQIELGAGDSAIYFGNAESAMVLAERLQYVISLMTGSDAAPVPAVAAPAGGWGMKTVDEALSFADRMYTKSSFAGVLAAEVRRLREENERKNRLFTDAVSALAAIDAALGMPEDGCNSTDKTITAIKLMHAVRVDDEKEITRLTEENERLRERAKTIGELEQLAARSNNNLLVENDRLREENERLRKDAERYRWLRDYSATSHLVCRMFVTRYIGSATIPVYQGSSLDSAIDAARGGK